MVTEASWQQLDQLVRVDVSSRLLGHPSQSLRDDIAEVRQELIGSPGSAADFLSLRDSQLPASDLTTFKAGWISSHLWPERPWCIGMRVVQEKDGRWKSPIVEQLRRLGHNCNFEVVQPLASRWARSKQKNQLKVDAISLPVQADGVGTIVKAISFTSLMAASRELLVGGEFAPLFASPGRVITGCEVRGIILNTLVRTEELLRAACPSVSWRKCVLIIDDGWSWNFQAHDVSAVNELFAPASTHDLDKFYDRSVLDYRNELSANPEFFQHLSTRRRADGLPLTLRDALNVAPLDRFVRTMCHMLALDDAQRMESSFVAPVEATKLHKLLEESIGLSYPRDMRRHDLEDVLRGGGFGRRLPYRTNAYGQTAVGLVRTQTMIHKYNPMTPVSTDEVMNLAMDQEIRWRHSGGSISG